LRILARKDEKTCLMKNEIPSVRMEMDMEVEMEMKWK